MYRKCKNCRLYALLTATDWKQQKTNHINVDIQAMLLWLISRFYDFCCLQSVADNSSYKLQFLHLSIEAYICPHVQIQMTLCQREWCRPANRRRFLKGPFSFYFFYCEVLWWVCLSVCLSAHISRKLHGRTSPIFMHRPTDWGRCDMLYFRFCGRRQVFTYTMGFLVHYAFMRIPKRWEHPKLLHLNDKDLQYIVGCELGQSLPAPIALSWESDQPAPMDGFWRSIWHDVFPCKNVWGSR